MMHMRIRIHGLILSFFLFSMILSAQVPEGGIQLNATTGSTWQKIGSKASAREVPVEGQEFTTAIEMTTGDNILQSWDAQLKFPAMEGVESGDVVLVAFRARTTDSHEETGEGFLNVIIELNKDPYTKELYHHISIGNEWREYYAPAEIVNSRATNQVSYLFHMGFENQTVEVAEVRFLNYKNTLTLEDLPITETSYVGRDPEAAWRAPAAERIEQHRKGAMKITVVNAQGQPVPDAQVQIRMSNHLFGFGSAIVAGKINTDKTYRENFFDMFNEAVFENDLKWPQFVNASRRATILPALDTLDGRGIPVRGHNIIWPSWNYMPDYMEDLKGQPEEMRNEIDAHFDEVVEFTRGRLNDWDVMNEAITNHQVQDILGDEVMADWYSRPLRIDRGVKLYMNDYSIISGGGKNTAKQDAYYKLIQDIESWGGTIHGIGMQGHFATELTSIEKIYEIVDRFSELGKDIKITEFDIDMTQDSVRVDYTRDFMTILFSHPSVKSILTWGFVANAHWKPDAAFFNEDWTIRPHGAMWRQMIKEVWWTPDLDAVTGAEGALEMEGFLGEYSYTVTSGADSRSGSFSLEQAKFSGITDSLVIRLDPALPEAVEITPEWEGFICEGDSLKLSATMAEGEEFSYRWTLDGEALEDSLAAIYASVAGSYQAELLRSDTAMGLVSPLYELEFRPKPEAMIMEEGPVSFCPGSSALLTGNEGAGLEYEWYLDQDRQQWGGTSMETDTPGKYSLQTTLNGCSSLSGGVSLIRLSAGDPACATGMSFPESGTRVYPNPCHGELHIELESALDRGGRLELFDATGRLKLRMELEAGSSIYVLPVTEKGLHLLRISRDGEVESHHVLAQ